MNCNNCGSELKEGSKFCISCGEKIDIDPKVSEEEEEDLYDEDIELSSANSNSNNPILNKTSIGIFLVLSLLSIFLIYLLISNYYLYK